MFKDNDDVAFGDINLSKDRITGNHNPGAGGWPTIRYFNKKTGIEGAAYEKKTSKSMCDELGPGEPYMRQYVEEYGKTSLSLCAIETGEGCSDREKDFAAKWTAKSPEELQKELSRLKSMARTSMKADLRDWLYKRLAVLKQISKSSHDEL